MRNEQHYRRMLEHNPNADGLDLVSEIACQCDECRRAYADGQEAAIAEIFSKNVNPDN